MIPRSVRTLITLASFPPSHLFSSSSSTSHPCSTFSTLSSSSSSSSSSPSSLSLHSSKAVWNSSLDFKTHQEQKASRPSHAERDRSSCDSKRMKTMKESVEKANFSKETFEVTSSSSSLSFSSLSVEKDKSLAQRRDGEEKIEENEEEHAMKRKMRSAGMKKKKKTKEEEDDDKRKKETLCRGERKEENKRIPEKNKKTFNTGQKKGKEKVSEKERKRRETREGGGVYTPQDEERDENISFGDSVVLEEDQIGTREKNRHSKKNNTNLYCSESKRILFSPFFTAEVLSLSNTWAICEQISTRRRYQQLGNKKKREEEEERKKTMQEVFLSQAKKQNEAHAELAKEKSHEMQERNGEMKKGVCMRGDDDRDGDQDHKEREREKRHHHLIMKKEETISLDKNKEEEEGDEEEEEMRVFHVEDNNSLAGFLVTTQIELDKVRKRERRKQELVPSDSTCLSSC